ncbi:piwi-like protein Siwi isoform X2 [Myzus persicae]|uniref:piwi-like protein Siwi isoform X2 n=1 Tax=Myzus persicae TaxID=13164 RepID=UPI000B934BAD|nr:piwi-like protein Siwi isoform X2 [Myzus persicae]
MDPNPSRRPRGKARGQSQGPLNQSGQTQGPPPNQSAQPRGPSSNQLGRPRGPQPAQPRGPPPNQLGRPRGPQPAQPRGPPPNQLGRPRGPQPAQAPPSRPQPRNMPGQSGQRQQFRSPPVEEVTSRIGSLKTGDAPMPTGRGLHRVHKPTPEYFRLERPESSKSSVGKQGAGGQPINLISNYFPITTYTDWSLYQYRVDFNPVQDRINIQRGLLSAHKDVLGAYIFDGTMLFSGQKYKPDTLELSSKRNFDDKIVIITIKFTSIIEKGNHASIQVFNLLLRRSLRNLDLALVGRNYYDEKAKINIPQHKLQLWPGYETTIGMYDSGLLLRSEISTKIMREETVLDFLKELASTRFTDPQWMEKFKAGVIGSTVLTRYNNQTYRIDDIDENSNTQSTFRKKDGSSISYVQYYKERYGIHLSSARQPMLVSKKKKSFKIEGDESELVYLIPELCTMTGITENMRKNFNLMKDLAVYTRVGPSKKISQYNNFINRILTTPKSAESLTQWNLTLSNNLVTIPGRVLAQEILQSYEKKYPAGIDADWTKYTRSIPMFTCAEIQHWAIVCPTNVIGRVKPFIQMILDVSRNMGFNLPPPQIYDVVNPKVHEYSITFEKVISAMNPSFILCFVSTTRGDYYSGIKRKLCIERSVPSQVVLTKQIEKANMSVCTKIAIQINCKLGGAPWRVVIPEKDMMIVGFDVCHDKQNINKSYGALVATMNDSHTAYFSCVQPHESGQELSSYFAMSIAKALNKYKSKNNKLPNSIIIYRDGVGDGQLSYVHGTEVDMVKKTCKDFYGGKKIGLAFVIVKKRISSRFFCKDSKFYQNPPPGTVIDSVVTDPSTISS